MPAGDFVQGAIQGYEFVDKAYDKSADRKIQRTAIETEETRYQEGQDRQDNLDEQNRTQQEFQNTTAQSRLEEQRAQTASIQERTANQIANNDFNQTRLTAADNRQTADRNKSELLEQNMIWGQRAHEMGEVYPIELHNQLVASGLTGHSYYAEMVNPEYQRATMEMKPIMDQVGAGNMNAIRDQRVVDNFNIMYAEDLKKGVGEMNVQYNSPIASKRVKQIYPTPGRPGEVTVELDVVLENGTVYQAPMTVGATSDDADPVKSVPLDNLMSDMSGRIRMAEHRAENKINIRKMYDLQIGHNTPMKVESREYAAEYRTAYQDAFETITKPNSNTYEPMASAEAHRRVIQMLEGAGMYPPKYSNVDQTRTKDGYQLNNTPMVVNMDEPVMPEGNWSQVN
jgi:hypothetical protein